MKKLIIICATTLFIMAIHVTTHAQETLKVISYNVLYGLKQDSVNINRFIKFAHSWNPDVIALEEMNGYTQKTLEQLGNQINHHYVLQSKEEGFPVAITSKYPLVNFKKVTENMWHSYIYTKIRGIHFFVIHFSPFSYQKRLLEITDILAQVQEIPDNEPILIMGDFNSLDIADQAMYGPEVLAAMQQSEQKHNHIRNLRDGQIDYSVLGKLREAGFQDTYRLLHQEFESSVPTFKDGNGRIKKSNSGHPKRIDFIWANPIATKMVVKSGIIKNEETHYISDHYPTFIELKIGK
ncbi:endonuclease/exonuclease/phosphatase family protein [Sphingobacterium sp. N143]|uniref:endonuclease/exonuclease/phosphatase family protein n=1 Tax=Sphingobacterium sp. N143 TaxID=2746727 RepID=UPI0025756F99|nr:endonuclease/exonuclease/phosphatase family protein [Sphingobacterium sp. N143]MDM1294192.1 endonuclease/exonuclease/phosphatase family protein [Sphingobacterium sp. N143]